MQLLDALGRRYGARPSSFVAGFGEFEALAIDIAAATAGAGAEEAAKRLARERGR